MNLVLFDVYLLFFYDSTPHPMSIQNTGFRVTENR